jgi:hypothetical protein
MYLMQNKQLFLLVKLIYLENQKFLQFYYTCTGVVKFSAAASFIFSFY